MQLQPDEIGKKIKEVRQEYKNLDDNILGISYMKKYGPVNMPGGQVSSFDQKTPYSSNFQDVQGGFLGKILSSLGKITQKFGNKSSVEKYSGGVNYGTDFAVPKGTVAFLPQGNWEVVDVFDQATFEGPNNPQQGVNRGYGNSVLVKNKDTGEKLRFSHLSKVAVKKGQTTVGGRPIGLTGATGNVAGRTGAHLDLEAYDPSGKLVDVFKTKYKDYL